MSRAQVDELTRRERIGRALRLLRQERGWTQTRLAEHCSSRSSLAAYEAAQSEPQVSTLLEILEAMGYGLSDFENALERAREGSSRGKRLASDSGAEESRVKRRAFMVVDFSVETPHGLERELEEWEDLIDRLTAFTYRHAASVAPERGRADRRTARDESSGDGSDESCKAAEDR